MHNELHCNQVCRPLLINERQATKVSTKGFKESLNEKKIDNRNIPNIA